MNTINEVNLLKVTIIKLVSSSMTQKADLEEAKRLIDILTEMIKPVEFVDSVGV